LLTGEYVILDGAIALAVPSKFGQSLKVKAINQPVLKWKSLNYKDKIWHESLFIFDPNLNHFTTPNTDPVSTRLKQLIEVARNLNPLFLLPECTNNKGLLVTSKLEFPLNWGLGSSSTLLNNIAQWAGIDAFKLSNATFGGSGYDIACAQNKTSILYALDSKKQNAQPIDFDPVFKSQLFFVHLNKKQNSRDSIKTYENNKININEAIKKTNAITQTLITTNILGDFEHLLTKHEMIIGKVTNQTPIKARYFKDYKRTIKSLGGWGGDFILVTGNESYVRAYFEPKGYKTILGYSDIILNSN